MKDNKIIIIEEFNELKGQFVLPCFEKPQRLIAVGSDDMDYYWVTYDGVKTFWHTCVGRIMPLKGYIRNEDYSEIVRLAKLNHHDLCIKNYYPEKYERYIKELMNTKDYYLTDFYFDLENAA